MGFDTIAKSEDELWVQYAGPVSGPPAPDLFESRRGVRRLCRPAAEAMQRLAADAMEFGSLHYEQWLETYEELRAAAARLIGRETRAKSRS